MQAQNVHLIMQSKVSFANQVELNLTRFASGERACSLLTLPENRLSGKVVPEIAVPVASVRYADYTSMWLLTLCRETTRHGWLLLAL